MQRRFTFKSFLRGSRIILDAALAALYGVTTKRFNEQVRRNKTRFPPDFMLQVTSEEQLALRSHFATSNNERSGRGGIDGPSGSRLTSGQSARADDTKALG